MRDQVDVPIATAGLHFRGTVHNPPVLHRIGPEPFPEPDAIVGSVPPVDAGAGDLITFLLPCLGPSDPPWQGNHSGQESQEPASRVTLL